LQELLASKARAGPVSVPRRAHLSRGGPICPETGQSPSHFTQSLPPTRPPPSSAKGERLQQRTRGPAYAAWPSSVVTHVRECDLYRGAPGIGPRWCKPARQKRLQGLRRRNCHGARPAHLIITMIKWIRTSRLSISRRRSRARAPRPSRCASPVPGTCFGLRRVRGSAFREFGVWGLGFGV